MPSSSLILHQGRSLTLKRTAPEDAPLLFEKMYSRYDFMRLFRLNDLTQHVDQVRERLIQRSQVPPARSGYLECLLVHKRHGPIGVVAAADYAPLHQRAELLIGIFDETYRSVSYGLEACLLMGDLAFNAYQLHRLFAYSYAYNQPAHQALESGGFQLEGKMNDHLIDAETQQYTDLLIYGMTVDQFHTNNRLAKLSQRLVGRDITQPLISPLSPPQEVSTLLPISSAPFKPYTAFRKSGVTLIHPS